MKRERNRLCQKLRKARREIGEDIYLWTLSGSSMEAYLSLFDGVLSEEERRRKNEYKFGRDERNYLIRRGALRFILSSSIGVDPESVRFHYGPKGKPELDDVGKERNIRFNLSHSGDVVLCVLSTDRRIGVDVERIRPLKNMSDIVERFFTRSERLVLDTLPAENRVEAFYKWWTQKEAVIKALGEGVPETIQRFSVNIFPAEPPGVLKVSEGFRQACEFQLILLKPVPGYLGMVAVEKTGETGRIDDIS